jgi:hypothetical protein
VGRDREAQELTLDQSLALPLPGGVTAERLPQHGDNADPPRGQVRKLCEMSRSKFSRYLLPTHTRSWGPSLCDPHHDYSV